ncbi:hypothetical protein EYC84_003196 [Monilinia fructicola]|uniref:Uncharacterized protein n=1 Tax=Monilinia fructicola TaxID=38448 RepID=A0A5M9JSW3_MONFR|nr:hypothetical protein EYC84_003196 [Monilinia fructicola]
MMGSSKEIPRNEPNHHMMKIFGGVIFSIFEMVEFSIGMKWDFLKSDQLLWIAIQWNCHHQSSSFLLSFPPFVHQPFFHPLPFNISSFPLPFPLLLSSSPILSSSSSLPILSSHPHPLFIPPISPQYKTNIPSTKLSFPQKKGQKRVTNHKVSRKINNYLLPTHHIPSLTNPNPSNLLDPKLIQTYQVNKQKTSQILSSFPSFLVRVSTTRSYFFHFPLHFIYIIDNNEIWGKSKPSISLTIGSILCKTQLHIDLGRSIIHHPTSHFLWTSFFALDFYSQH